MSSSFCYPPGPTNTDTVSLSALRLATTVGPDRWHHIRPQPICLSLHLHLAPSYLDTPGQSDAVTDSLHYGHLAKAVERRVSGRAESRAYKSPRALVEDVTEAAFEFVRDALRGNGSGGGRDPVPGVEVVEAVPAVRVVLELPKQILLAQGFEVELTTHASDYWASRSGGGSGSRTTVSGAIVRVKNLILPVLIGVNPPERLAKQHVITHLTFFEAARANTGVGGDMGPGEMDYPSVVQQIATYIENSDYLTLERLVYQTIYIAYRAFDAHANSSSNASRIDAITVRCQKPSALSFADASGVEMTRTREALGLMGR